MIELNSSQCWKSEEGHIWARIHSFADKPFSMKDAHDHIEATFNLCHEKAQPFIMDLRDLQSTVDPTVIFFLATETKLQALRSSLAFISNSLNGWFFASHFSNYVDKLYPCKVFQQEEDAILWLKSLS
ncbi:MAG: hypothetical protein AAFR87_26275 [Bacteroidota bacterium]